MNGSTRRRIFRALATLVATAGLALSSAVVVVPVASATPPVVAPAAADARFEYLTPDLPISASNQLGEFSAQVRYGDNGSLSWAWRLSDLAISEIPRGQQVTTTYEVTVNGRQVDWHFKPKTTHPDYLWHSSISTFNYQGDAPWTRAWDKKRLKYGDVVRIYGQASWDTGGDTYRFHYLDYTLKMY